MDRRGWIVKPATGALLAVVLLFGIPLAATFGGPARAGTVERSQAEPGVLPACTDRPVDGVTDALFARVHLGAGELAIHVVDPVRGAAVCRLPFGATALSADGRSLFIGQATHVDGQLITQVIAVERATGAISGIYDVSTRPATDGPSGARLPSPAIVPSPDGRQLYLLAVDRLAAPGGSPANTTWPTELFVLDLESGAVSAPLPISSATKAVHSWTELLASPDGSTLYAVERHFQPADPANGSVWEDELATVRATTIRTDPLEVVGSTSVALVGTEANGEDRWVNCGLGYEASLGVTPDGSALYGFCHGGSSGTGGPALPPVLRFFDPATLRETKSVELAPDDPDASTLDVFSADRRLLYLVDVTETTRAIRVVDLARGEVVQTTALTPPTLLGTSSLERGIAWMGRTMAPSAAAKGLAMAAALAPDGRHLVVSVGDGGIWTVALSDFQVTRFFGSGLSFLDLAFSTSGTFLVALEGIHDLTTFTATGDDGRSVGNGLKAEALFNEVLFP